MKPPVPALFVLGWVGIAAAFDGAHWAYAMYLDPWRADWDPDMASAAWWSVFLVQTAAFCFGEAFVQSRLLRRHGRPVPGWTARVGGGEGGLSLLYLFVLLAIGGLGVRTFTSVWELAAARLGEDVLLSTASGGVVAFAVWGRRWAGVWMLWLTGRMILGPTASLVAWSLQIALLEGDIRLASETLGYLLEFVRCIVVAAGTAWLLWRLVLPSSPIPDSASPDSPQP